MIAEHLCGLDDACEILGGLRRLNLGGAVRERIRQRISSSYRSASLSGAASSSEGPSKYDIQVSLSHHDPNSDNASIVSKRSISSGVSTIWTKIPSSSRKIPLAISDMCSYIDSTPDAARAPIKELVVRKEKYGFRHEFLHILLAKPSGEEFWMRLERTRPPGRVDKLLSSSVLVENDIVSAVADLYWSFTASPVRQSFQGNLVHCKVRPRAWR